MPTRLCLPLLLAILVPALGGAQERADSQSLKMPEEFNRMRSGAVSSGPASARRVDTAVEPVLFRSYGEPKPLPKAEHHVDAQPAEPQPIEPAEPVPAEPLALEHEPSPIEQPQVVQEPPEEESAAAPSSDHSNRRLLVSPEKRSTDETKRKGVAANPLESLMQWRPSSKTLTATGGGLAIAVGLLLSTVWLIRSCSPKSSRLLPRDVVEVLGRMSLGGKQTGQLVRVGSKLVLVAITPDGAETLTEITDPDEVARLVAACDSKSGRGSTADFDRLLHEMSDTRTTSGFLDRSDSKNDRYGFADGAFDPRSLAAAYANTPGGRGDG